MASFFELVWLTPPEVTVNKIDKFSYNIRSFREPLDRAVRQVLVPDIQDQFSSGGNPRWKELAASTKEAKKRMGLDRGILVRTGDLRKAATQISQWKVTSDNAYYIGLPSSVSYGYPMDMGFDNARTNRHVDPREFIRLTSRQEDAIEVIFEEWLEERAARYLS